MDEAPPPVPSIDPLFEDETVPSAKDWWVALPALAGTFVVGTVVGYLVLFLPYLLVHLTLGADRGEGVRPEFHWFNPWLLALSLGIGAIIAWALVMRPDGEDEPASELVPQS